MGEDGKKDTDYSRSEIEDFFYKNKDFIESLIEKERKAAESIYEAEKESARQHADKVKKGTEDVIKKIYKTAMDPEIQGHFMTAGFEIMLGINAALRSMPVPDFMKDEEESEAKEEPVPDKAKPKAKPRTKSKAIAIDAPEEVPKTVTRRKKKPAGEVQDGS